MRFLWTEQSIRWFLAASNYTSFHHKLAQLIRPYLSPKDCCLDLGCGLGRLDLSLAPYVQKIIGIDIEPKVVKRLVEDAATYGLTNLHALCSDTGQFHQVVDVVIMSFYGKSGRNMADYYRLCNKSLIRIVNTANRGNLYPSQHRHTTKDTVAIVQKELSAQGRRYQLAVHTLEFGQPLVSKDDAAQFVLAQAPAASAAEISAFLNRNLQPTGRQDFPFYLPNPKELGIFVIEKEAANADIC